MLKRIIVSFVEHVLSMRAGEILFWGLAYAMALDWYFGRTVLL